MKVRISLLYSGSISSLNGVSTFIKSIRNVFKTDPDIELSILANDVTLSTDSIYPDQEQLQMPRKDMKKGIKAIIQNVLRRLSRSSAFFSFVYAYRAYNINAKSVVLRKGAECKSSDILFFQEVFTAYYYSRQVKRTVTQKRILVLHIDGNPLSMLYGYFPKLGTNRLTNKYFRMLIYECFDSVDKIVLLSELAKRNFVALYPDYEELVEVIPNGIGDVPERLVKEKEPTKHLNIVCVGTVNKRKGQDLLINAIADLSPAIRSRVQLSVIGEGVLLEELRRKQTELGWDFVKFEGARNDVWKYLAKSDLFILPSHDEGMPIAIIEAMRAGLPVVGTPVGAVPDLILDGINGWLVPPEVTAVKVIIEEILQGKYDLNEYSRQSRLRYEKFFNADVMTAKYRSLFLKVLVR